MNDSLSSSYLRNIPCKGITKEDVVLLNNVNCDTLYKTLLKIFDFWTYEIIRNEKMVFLSEEYLYTEIALYLPGAVMTGHHYTPIENIDSIEVSIKQAVSKAIINALNTYFILDEEDLKFEEKVSNFDNGETIIYENNVNEDNEKIETTTLDEIEKEEIKPKNQFGLRDDQIEFINNFKTENNIDTSEKFDYYVKAWSDNTSHDIATKNELIKAGEKILDEFIKWIKVVQVENIINKTVLSPI